MPIPTRMSKAKEDLDTSQLSAYAVYNNLVPGVKAYEDTSESTQASKRKKSKKKANKKAAVEAGIKNELAKLIDNGQAKTKKGTTATVTRTDNKSPATKELGLPKTGKNIATITTNKGAQDVQIPQEKTVKTPKRKNKKSLNGTPPPAENNANTSKNQAGGQPGINDIDRPLTDPKEKTPKRKNKKSLNGTPTDDKANTSKTQVDGQAGVIDKSFTEKKKRKRNKNKNKGNSSEKAKPVDDFEPEEAPPHKLRKLSPGKFPGDNFLPNPLASQKQHNIVKNGDVDQKGTSKRKNKSLDNSVKTIETLSPGNKNLAAEFGKNSHPSKKKKNKNKTAEDADDTEPDQVQYEESPDLPNVFDLINAKPVQDSVSHGESLFKWLINPQPLSAFKDQFWEKAPLLIKRNDVFPEYYEWILSTSALDDMLRKNVLKYSENIDITAYENGVRETISSELTGRARPAAVWDFYSTGHSVRILNPQTYCKPLWRLNASLQEFMGSFVGANVYLTPPDSQGFAPHYDDIEAFILQVEGKKHWKVYKPRSANSELPQFSSKDFKKGELGKPFLDIILEEGDLLYFPRGWIHEAETVDGCHSMHITLSCYQQNTWSSLLKQHFAKSLDKITANAVDFRRGLPTDYLSFMGIAHSGSKDKDILSKRKEFKKTLRKLMEKVIDEEADDAADEMGKKFIWDSLPPYLTRKEKDITVEEDGEFLNNGRVKNRVEMDPDVQVKLLRKNCIRLIREENVLRLYFSIENPLVYHADESQYLELPEEYGPGVLHLIQTYPEFTRIEDVPMASGDIAKKIQLVTDFWERGILMTKKPLEAGEIDDEDFDFDDEDGEEILDDESGDDLEEDYDDSCSEDDVELSEDGLFIDDDDASSSNIDDEDAEFLDEDGLPASDEGHSNDDEEDILDLDDMEGTDDDEEDALDLNDMEGTDDDEVLFEVSD